MSKIICILLVYCCVVFIPFSVWNISSTSGVHVYRHKCLLCTNIRHNRVTLFVSLYFACNHSLQMDLFNPKTVLGYSLAKRPGQMSLSENLKSSKSLTSSSRNSSPPLLEFHLVRNQLLASRNLSQYLGGELFLNLHLKFPILVYLQFLGRTNWSSEFPSSKVSLKLDQSVDTCYNQTLVRTTRERAG